MGLVTLLVVTLLVAALVIFTLLLVAGCAREEAKASQAECEVLRGRMWETGKWPVASDQLPVEWPMRWEGWCVPLTTEEKEFIRSQNVGKLRLLNEG